MIWNLAEAMDYYKKQGAPGDQSALIGLLREIQKENGGITREEIGIIAREYAIKDGVLLALVKRIPSLQLRDVQVLELCAGPNCGKHTALAACGEKLAKESGGKVEVKFMPCMRMCAKGPNVRLNGTVHHGVTEKYLKELLSK